MTPCAATLCAFWTLVIAYVAAAPVVALSPVASYLIQMVLMSPPSVRATGVVATSSLFGTVGRGKTDRSSPGCPPGWLFTYQVKPPLVQIKFNSAVTV